MATTARPMSRWRAAGIHLAASALVALTLTGSLLFLWYPPPFFAAAGADYLALTIIGVDIVLGPLLTLIVFKQGKWGMKFDMVVIVSLQIAALIYGLWVVGQSRPVFLVAVMDRINMVYAIEVDREALARNPEFSPLPLFGYRLISARIPETVEERNRLLDLNLQGVDLQHMPEYYQPYAAGAAQLLERARPIALLIERYPEARDRIQGLAADAGFDPATLVFVPVDARKQSITALLRPDNGEILAFLGLDAWEALAP